MNTVIITIKKAVLLKNVNQKFLETLNREKAKVGLMPVTLESEVDEQWSFVVSKKQQRWLWHAIDHASGRVLAYVFRRRQDKAFLKLKHLLTPLINSSAIII